MTKRIGLVIMENSLNNKILYIEDDILISQMYGDYLKQAGFDVTLERNGDRGLAIARDQHFDVILLDLMLPGKGGGQLLKALRERENLIPDSLVIIMTNYQYQEKTKQELEQQADAYFIKTELTPSQLVENIELLLENK